MELFSSTNKKRQDKRGQGWSLDLTIAIVIFIAGVIILYFYAINYSSQNQKDLEEMNYEATVASELILSEDENGILTDNTVNQTKLDNFALNYNSRKNEMGIIRNFYFNMTGLEGQNGNPISHIGNYNANPDNLIKVTRVTVYKNKPVRFDLYVWQNE